MMKSIVFLFFVSKVLSQNCTLDLSDAESPLIVNEDFTVPIYDSDKNQSLISFQPAAVFYAMCPKDTHSPYIIEEGDKLACVVGTNVLNIRTVEVIDFAAIKCKASGSATVRKLDQQCWRNGTLYEIGFNVYNEFVSMVTVCFDEAKLAPIYSKYNNTWLSGAQWSGEIKNIYEESFVCDQIPCAWVDNGNVYRDVDVDGVYNNQAEILQDLGFDDVYLARFPLTMTFLSQITSPNNRQRLQFIPYFDYMNLVPVWNIKHSVEGFIKWILSSVAEPTFGGQTIISGTLGVVTSPNNEEIELYLYDGKIPVPQWVWLVLEELRAIVFFYNSPSPDHAETTIHPLCTSKAECMAEYFCFCYYDSVLDAEMRELIANNFN